jgi:hypothetical protein
MKIVNGKKYIHKSALNQLSEQELNRVNKAKELLPYSCSSDYNIIAFTKDQVEFIMCNSFDYYYEPIIDYRFIVKMNDKLIGKEVLFRKSDESNPRVFHKRYLFINKTYKNFSYEDDKTRGDYIDSLGLDKKKIGRFIYWNNILKKYNLEFFSPNKHKGTLK